jgi:hypothetical protein
MSPGVRGTNVTPARQQTETLASRFSLHSATGFLIYRVKLIHAKGMIMIIRTKQGTVSIDRDGFRGPWAYLLKRKAIPLSEISSVAIGGNNKQCQEPRHHRHGVRLSGVNVS